MAWRLTHPLALYSFEIGIDMSLQRAKNVGNI